MSWLHDMLVGFDLETTGTEPAESRLVTAALLEVKEGEPVRRREWLADPGVAIPAEATAIHGITTQRAVTEGRPAADVVAEVAAALVAYWRADIPVVVYNAPFDLSLLAAELRRHDLPSLERQLGGVAVGPVVDPLVVDRAVDKYRKGSRSLENASALYGVRLDDAHEAGADALAAVRVALALGERYGRQVGDLTPQELHEQQVGWHAEWAAGLQDWLRRKKDPAAVVDGTWPLR
ncbi:exonuclease domain-containing protein [Streptacidiphilus jiangxiensis]|uniref:DNA polymerase-3 subunit epsilon n=1 Tax=Streptacidiphilus jiangxiensis TaxID=235985 RepID=A0A1H7SKE6_STRJI|nr:exonuclease domain-containing protein [Streptacidiphilus jiangxiensis]SEL71897.1 DNA polymerase-3 subunit epsilon [Streptacidiphilus jiangxiensis]